MSLKRHRQALICLIVFHETLLLPYFIHFVFVKSASASKSVEMLMQPSKLVRFTHFQPATDNL